MGARKKKNKEDIINLRAKPEQKTLIQRAADALGMSAASFILENSLRAARNELAAIEQLDLAKHDADIFLTALENPPKPNAALKKAFEDYEKKFAR